MANYFRQQKVLAERKMARDTHFFKKHVYVFELQSGASEGSVFFPLVLAPQSITLSDPFTTNVTPTLGGGVYAEESGILTRRLRISGDLGWAPKKWRTLSNNVLSNTNPELADSLSFHPERTEGVKALTLSGPKQLQFLQDRIFRIYGDLKRHPTHGPGTKLIWHNFKDQEHWHVIPQNFSISRTAQRPLSYPYDISLLVVDTAKDSLQGEAFLEKEDAGILAAISDGAKTVRDVSRSISAEARRGAAWLDDTFYTGALSSLQQTLASVANIGNLLTDAVRLGQDAATLPADLISGLITELSSSISQLVDAAAVFPPNVIHAWVSLERSMERLTVAHLALGERDIRLAGFRRRYGSPSRAALAAAEATPPPTSPGAFGRTGTALMAGDRDSLAEIDSGLADRTQEPKGITEYTIRMGDSLRGLAARFLGNAARWVELAEMNRLSAPYISIHGAAGTLRPGDTILLPTQSNADRTKIPIGIVGVSDRDDKHVRLFGTDVLVEPPYGEQLYDMQIAPDSDGTDIARVKGIDNLKQGIRSRVITERGTDLLYKRVGLLPVVGVGLAEVDRELLRLHIARGVSDDPRVANVSDVRLSDSAPADAVVVELDAEVVGLHERTVVRAEIN